MSRDKILKAIRKHRPHVSLNGARVRVLLLLLLYPLFFSGLALLGFLCVLAFPVGLIPGIILLWDSLPRLLRMLQARSLSLPPAKILQGNARAALEPIVRDICHTLRCRPPARYELDRASNLSVYVLRGLLFPKSVLRVGLPVLMTTSMDEFRSAIAHECGHLRQTDDFWGRVLHRATVGWIAGMDGEARGQTSRWKWTRGFACWFWSRFQIWSSIHARLSEEGADRFSEKVFPGATAAHARYILNCTYGGKLADDWFKETLELSSSPPKPYFRGLLDFIRSKWEPAQAQRHLKTLLATPDNEFAPHPPLARLLEIGGETAESISLEPPPVVDESAALRLFGEQWSDLEQELDELQRLEILNWWQENSKLRQRARADVVMVSENGNTGREVSLADAWLVLGESERALPYLRKTADAAKDDARTWATLASVACRADATDAAALVDHVFEKFPLHAGGALQELIDYYARREDSLAAERAWVRLLVYQDAFEKSQLERESLGENDVLIPHLLQPKILAHLRAILAQQEDVRQVRVARKKLSLFPNSPVHVFLVDFCGATRGSRNLVKKRQQELANLISQIAGECFVINRRWGVHLWNKAVKMQNSLLFLKE